MIDGVNRKCCSSWGSWHLNWGESWQVRWPQSLILARNSGIRASATMGWVVFVWQLEGEDLDVNRPFLLDSWSFKERLLALCNTNLKLHGRMFFFVFCWSLKERLCSRLFWLFLVLAWSLKTNTRLQWGLGLTSVHLGPCWLSVVGAGSARLSFSGDLGAYQVPLPKILVYKVGFARLLRDLAITWVSCSVVVLVCCWFVAALCVDSARE